MKKTLALLAFLLLPSLAEAQTIPNSVFAPNSPWNTPITNRQVLPYP